MKPFCLFLLVFLGLSCTQDLYTRTGSSRPLTAKEDIQYRETLIRCQKTGGTRIVKISNELRCF